MPGLSRVGGIAAAILLAVTLPRAFAVPDPLDGQPLGSFRITYYRLAETERAETQAAPGLLPVHGRSCQRIIAWVPESFHSDLGLQGSGVLPDGRLLNFEERCPCATPTRRGDRICYAELKRTEFPFGRGAEVKDKGGRGQAFWLQPFRSVAVDPDVVGMGKVLYVPALRGGKLPHGAEHNGCLRAEDTGRAIKGLRLDLFAGGTKAPKDVLLLPHLPKGLPDQPVPVFVDSRRCVGAFP